jgi:hypothetical protein
MALSITLASEFDASAVCFSKIRKNKSGGKTIYLSGPGNQKLYLQLPYMRCPFGLSSFTDDKTGKVSYNLNLSFDLDDPEVEKLAQTFKTLDEKIVETVSQNSVEWLGKKYNASVIKEALYKPLVRPGKENYAATLNLKVYHDEKTGNFVPEAYNSRREQVPLDTIEKGGRVLTIVDVSQIWVVDNKFGVSVILQQILLSPPKKLPAFSFQGVESAEEEVDEEEEIVDE